MPDMLPQWEANRKAEHTSLFHCFNGLDFKESISGPTDRNPNYYDLGPFSAIQFESDKDIWIEKQNIVLGSEYYWKEIAIRLIASVNSNLELQVSSWGRILIGLDWGAPRTPNVHSPTISTTFGYIGVPFVKDILDTKEYNYAGYTGNLTSQMLGKPHFGWDTAIPEQSGCDNNNKRFQILWDHVFQCCINGPCVYHHECIIPIDTVVNSSYFKNNFGQLYPTWCPNLFIFWTGPAGVDSQKCLQGMLSLEARFLDDRDRNNK